LEAGSGPPLFVNTLVLRTAFDRIGGFLEHPFYPFVEEQARAVDEFVDHPCRQILRQGIGLSQPASGIGCVAIGPRFYP